MGKITKEFSLSDVTGLDIPKPAGYDKAVQAVENGQGASVVALLTKIVADYRMLQWDKPAGRYLALAPLAARNAQTAYAHRSSLKTRPPPIPAIWPPPIGRRC